jgi:hypothetical protein
MTTLAIHEPSLHTYGICFVKHKPPSYTVPHDCSLKWSNNYWFTVKQRPPGASCTLQNAATYQLSSDLYVYTATKLMHERNMVLTAIQLTLIDDILVGFYALLLQKEGINCTDITDYERMQQSI